MLKTQIIQKRITIKIQNLLCENDETIDILSYLPYKSFKTIQFQNSLCLLSFIIKKTLSISKKVHFNNNQQINCIKTFLKFFLVHRKLLRLY